MTKRGGLGRGLGALIPAGAVGTPTGAPTVRALPVDAITPNPRQPRSQFDEDELTELAESVRLVGVLQPVVVRPAGDGRWELVMGERRWRAARLAGLDSVPALVRDTPDDDLLRDALIENIHRAALNPLEEAAAYRQLLDDFGVTHEELASRLGRSRAHVTNTLRLLNLPAEVQTKLAAGVLTAGHARALLGLADPAAQIRLADRVVAEGLSVRSVEELVAVGEPAQRTRRPGRPRPPDPELDQLARDLSDRWDTRVSVQLGRRKGRLVVEFASAEDLARILDRLAPNAWADRAG
jgi:ParB family chromosome partitioning protein